MKLPGRPTEQNGTVFSLSFNTRVRDPLSQSPAQPEGLTSRAERGFSELQSSHAVKTSFAGPPPDKFWISVRGEYLAMRRKAVNISLQFSTPYKREQALTC